MQPINLAISLWLGLCTTARAFTAAARSTPGSVSPLCNGYAALCNRRYSNVTYVAAHNSPFNVFGNPGSNQAEDIETQLNDGTHLEDGAMHLCHTSCGLLDAGLLVDLLRRVSTWLTNHPAEVVTILMGNGDFVPAENFSLPVITSGLIEHVYHPPMADMTVDSWPTLGDMISNKSRVIMMLDYGADVRTVPWLLDEFQVMWETPFSPTDPTFPCTPDRPPNADPAWLQSKMYLANHNLNTQISLNISEREIEILVPTLTQLDTTNADHGNGSVGEARRQCHADWSRSPNFLLVDYYERGNFPGSVFSVAAAANGLPYAHTGASNQVRRGDAVSLVSFCLGLILLWRAAVD